MFGWSSLFRSRWAALIWAVGICWTAIGLMPDAPPPADDQSNAATPADDAAQVQHLQQLVAKLEHS